MKRLWLAAFALTGCNRYDLFLVDAGQQAGLANQADVLFIIDDSDSMVQESVDMAENFTSFIQRLSTKQGSYGTDGLTSAAEAYIQRGLDPASFTDVRLSLTTIDATANGGLLLGEVLTNNAPDAGAAFVETLLCEATCFSGRSVAPTDPAYACGDPLVTVSQESLDCLCGDSEWVGNCGSGTETGLEAAYGAACRAVDDPPEACFESIAGLSPAEVGANEGMLRPDTTFIPVIVTDEGDNSPRMNTTDAFPQIYADLFRELGMFTSWAVIGPDLDDNYEPLCPGATGWGTLRYDYMVEGSGGLKLPIHDPGCQPQDFGAALDRLGELIGGDIHAFPLDQLPVEGSIVVQVDRRPIDEAEPEGEGLFGRPLYGDGWSYDPVDNLVRLHGEARPEPEQQVSVYYLPRRGR